MALDIASLLNTGNVGVQTQAITGDAQSAAAAAGYAAFILAVIGSAPAVKDLGNKRAKIVLTSAQNNAMQAWLDSQVKSMVALPGAQQPALDLSMGDYLTPWTLKYTLPALIGAFAAGWVANWIFSGKR